jgi:stress response protein SCP2
MVKKEIKNTNKVQGNDYNELVSLFGAEFKKINQYLGKIDQRFEKIDQRFERMQLSIDLKFEAMDEKKADKKDIDNLRDEMITHIDGLAKKIDDYQTEQAMITNQLNRHEKWHFRTAAKVGIDLLSD